MSKPKPPHQPTTREELDKEHSRQVEYLSSRVKVKKK